MQWILEVPKISDGVLFTYEVIVFLFLIAGLILSVLVCMYGYKMLRIAFIIGASFLFGLLGFRVSGRLTSMLTMKLVFFVCFIFIGLVLLQMALMLLGIPVKKLKLDRLFLKNQFWITALLGAGAFGLLVFSRVFRNLLAVILLSLILAAAGGAVQYRKKERERPAHIYDDLLKMPRRPAPEEGAQE